VRPLYRLGCAPEGGLCAASENWRTLDVFRRQQDGGWARVAFVDPLPAPSGREGLAQRSFTWLRGPDQSWRILAPTREGLLEFSLAGDRLAFVDIYLEADVINRVAVSVDEQTMALYTMGRRLHLFERDGWRWRERRATTVGIDNVLVAFDAEARLLVTAADEVRVYDQELEVVDLLPTVDGLGLLEARRVPDAAKIVTIAANYVVCEHWVDFERVLAEARRLLALRKGTRDGIAAGR
jgi:hypothetical protein